MRIVSPSVATNTGLLDFFSRRTSPIAEQLTNGNVRNFVVRCLRHIRWGGNRARHDGIPLEPEACARRSIGCMANDRSGDMVWRLRNRGTSRGNRRQAATCSDRVRRHIHGPCLLVHHSRPPHRPHSNHLSAAVTGIADYSGDYCLSHGHQ